MKKIFTLVLLSLSIFGFTQSTTVVISQVYGGGGSSSAAALYKTDYVELHNISNVSQDISGFSIQYGSSTGQFGGTTGSNIAVIPAGTIIPAGGYYLISLGSAGTGGADLPTADFTSANINMAAGSGKVALVDNATPLTCGATALPCVIPTAGIIDIVAYGAANNGEGGTTVNNSVAMTNAQAGVRKNSGCQETNNNNNDFDVSATPAPRSSSSTAVNCTTMPLSLISFSAALSDNKVQLIWSTANEVNFSNFEVERSINGKDFITISKRLESKGGNTNNYSFVDENPVAGVSYYRLKMNDKDGSFKYSGIEIVKTKTIGVSVYPNPVRSSITVQHEVAAKGAVISVINMNGKQVSSVIVEAGAVQTTINATQLAPGSYMVVYTNNGARQTKQFIKE